jgi:hypothetical protein
VLDTFYKGLEYKPVDLSYSGEAPLRTKHLPSPAKLAPNPIPEPEVQTAQRHEVTLTAGMMGGSGMGGMMMGGGSMWAINGVPMPDGHMGEMEPNLDGHRGKTYVLAIENRPPGTTRSTYTGIPSASSHTTENRPSVGSGGTTFLMVPRDAPKSPSAPMIPAIGCFTATSSTTRRAG